MCCVLCMNFLLIGTIGILPAGKWGVQVRLAADSDVDIQLYDVDDQVNAQNHKKFTEGGAVVAWCENAKTCNIGALGSDEGEGCIQYKAMRICYSGYGGVGSPGSEFITISGKLSTSLQMKAFAFAAGAAKIDYEWSREQTGCCLGILPCRGQFSAQIAEGQVLTWREGNSLHLTFRDVRFYRRPRSGRSHPARRTSLSRFTPKKTWTSNSGISLLLP